MTVNAGKQTPANSCRMAAMGHKQTPAHLHVPRACESNSIRSDPQWKFRLDTTKLPNNGVKSTSRLASKCRTP